MEEPSVFNQSYCYGCLCKIVVKPSSLFNFKNNTLIEILQVKQVPLCTHCIHRANQTEYFIENVQENQTFLENSFNLTHSTIKEAHMKYNPLFNCSTTKLNPIHFAGKDDDVYNDITIELKIDNEIIDKKETKVKIELDDAAAIFDDFIDDDGDNNEIDGVIKKEFLDEDEYPLNQLKELKALKLLKVRGAKKDRKTKRGVQEPWLNDIKIKKIKISKSQCMKELEQAKMDEKYASKLWKCTSCVKGFNCKLSFDQHMEKHSEKNGEFECSICTMRYLTENKLMWHKKYHLIRYKCPKCDYTRVMRESVRDHYTSAHSDDKTQYQCEFCSKVFKSYYYYKKHVYNTHNTQRLSCPYCSKSLKGRGSLNNHLIRMHPDKIPSTKKPCPFVCEDCGGAFPTKSRLRIHSLKHSNTKDFYCVECDRSFKTEYTLKYHLTTAMPHIANFPFACTQCDKKFATKRSYMNHMTTHTNSKPFKCDKCGKDYISNWSLKNHNKLAHEGYKRPMAFPCPMCDKIFDRNSILKSHIRIHTGERPYQCSKCSATFTQGSSLGTHMKLVHLKLTRDGKPKNSLKI